MKRHKVLDLSVVVATVFFSIVLPSVGQAQGPNIPGLAQRVAQLEILVTTLQNQVTTLQNSPAFLLGQYLTVDTANNRIVFTGANVQIVNGGGATHSVNGLGNLILGYNEEIIADTGTPICSLGDFTTQEDCEAAGHTWALNHKNGSHYLIVGPFHNYSQSGGIISGWQNSSNNLYASVIGGNLNTASGKASLVSGGVRNISSGIWSSVSGGIHNTASGDLSSLFGGVGTFASGGWSSDSDLAIVLNRAIDYVAEEATKALQAKDRDVYAAILEILQAFEGALAKRDGSELDCLLRERTGGEPCN